MRRTFCARCHAIGLSRCAHPTRVTGSGGKHRARETYRVHPAKTFVDVPTSPFLFSATATATKDMLAETLTPASSVRAAENPTAEQFTTLMHELWAAPSDPVGELPERMPAPTKQTSDSMRRALALIPVMLLILGVIGWRAYEPSGFGSDSSVVPAETLVNVTTELAALPATISEILEEDTPGTQLSEAATSLTRWSAQASALMSASVTADPSETDSDAYALAEDAGIHARALQTLLSDALSTRLIVTALDVSPELPQKASLDEITELRVSLALSLDNARTRLTLLPTSSAVMERGLFGMLNSMERDHELYLTALLAEDPETAAGTLSSLAATQQSIEAALSAYLVGLRPVANELLSDIEMLVGALG